MKYKAIGKFQKYILDWYSKNGRTFPWRYTFDAYKVLVSEILLQQTNVEKVINPYNTIVKNYKSVLELADADIIFLKDLFKDLGLFYRADRIISISRHSRAHCASVAGGVSWPGFDCRQITEWDVL